MTKMKQLSVFLIVVVLIAGMIGYGQPAPPLESQYIPVIAAGGWHMVGLKADGTMVAVGDNDFGQCNVGNWTGVVQVAAGYWHTVGLKSDGTVVAVGENSGGQCNVGGWTGIFQVAAGFFHAVGLKSNGTVVAAGPEIELAKWNLN